MLFRSGKIAGGCFDEIIIRMDKNLRGRKESEITGLLTKGIEQSKPGAIIKVIPDEEEAIMYAYENAIPGSIAVLLADKVDTSLELLKNLQDKELE